MADDAQDKTEQPTAKRREDAKDKGQVAKSQELNAVAVLISAILAFKASSSFFGHVLNNFMITTYHESSNMQLTVQSLPGQMIGFMKVFAALVLPVMGFILIAAVVSNVAQIKFIIAKKAINPDFKKINPLSGLKNMFSSRSLVELVKGILKILILAVISYYVLNKYRYEFLILPHRTVGEIVSFLGQVIYDLSFKVILALLVMAFADFGYQRYKHEKSLKMSKEEVKEETKQYEGDPHVKSKIRSKQKEVAFRRMMQEVPEATVVVTNPTHLAIALKYEPTSNMDAPKVVAKGKLKVAERIKRIAHDNGVPVVENKPLARSLYEICEIGMEIPVEFYQAVAEILSQIYQNDPRNLPRLGEVNG